MPITKTKLKKCQVCKKEFNPTYNRLQPTCSIKCASDLAKLKLQAKIDRQIEEINSPTKIEERYKKAVESQYDKGYYEKQLEAVINFICGLIDGKGSKCISCNGKGNQAGHFHSVGSNCSLRFNLHNLHLQDNNCNVERSANIIQYGKGLIERYGKEYKEYVEYDLVRIYPKLGLEIFELKEFKVRANIIKKRLIQENKVYSFEERIALRTSINKEIGIYNF